MKRSRFEQGERPLVILMRVALGIVFLYASLDKIADPAGFAMAVDNYRILPDVLVNPMAVVLPWLEAVCGLLLVFGQWTRTASLLVGLMLVSFTVAVVAAMARGLDVNCGCFDVDAGRRVGVKLLLQDLALLALAGVVAWRERDRLGRDGLFGKRVENRSVWGSTGTRAAFSTDC